MAILRIGSQKEYLRRMGGVDGGAARPHGMSVQAIAPAAGTVGQWLRTLPDAGGLVRLAAQGYREAQTEKVDQQLLNVEAEFEKWKNEYKETHQGADALDAAAQFTEKHAELARKAVENLDGESDEIFEGLLKSRLDHQSMYALKEGYGYQAGQKAAFEKSQWDGQLASFERFCQENAGDWQAVQFEAGNLAASWQAKNPGKDATAIREKLDETQTRLRMDTLLAEGRLEEAKAALGQGMVAPGGRANTSGLDAGLEKMIREAAARHGVDPELALKVCMQESSGNQASVSRAGAIGLFQLMPGTARELGVNPHDAAQNIDGGVRYIKRMLDRYGGDVQKGLTAYNWGMGNVDAWIKTGKGINGQAIPKEASEYYARVMGRGVGGAQARPLTGGGMAPLLRARYAEKIDAMERRAQAEAAQGMSAGINDYMAACEAGISADMPFSEEQIRAAYGDRADAVLGRMEQGAEYALYAQALPQMSAREQELLLRERMPEAGTEGFAEKLSWHGRLAKAIERDQKCRAADPVAYVLGQDQEVGAAFQAWLAAPDDANAWRAYRNGLESGMLMRGMEGGSYFSKQGGQLLGDVISMAEDPGLLLGAMQKSLGEDFPQVMAEAAPKIAPMVNIVASNVEPEAARLVLAAARDPQFVKNADAQLGLAGPDRQNFNDALADASRELCQTFLAAGDADTAERLREGMGLLARQYMLRLGIDYDDALERAASELGGDRYITGESPSGQPYRVPVGAGVSPAIVEDSAEAFVKDLDIGKLDITWARGRKSGQAGRLKRALLDEATWVTLPDESGIALFMGGQPVYYRDGGMVSLAFEDCHEQPKKTRANGPAYEDAFPMNEGPADPAPAKEAVADEDGWQPGTLWEAAFPQYDGTDNRADGKAGEKESARAEADAKPLPDLPLAISHTPMRQGTYPLMSAHAREAHPVEPVNELPDNPNPDQPGPEPDHASAAEDEAPLMSAHMGQAKKERSQGTIQRAGRRRLAEGLNILNMARQKRQVEK